MITQLFVLMLSIIQFGGVVADDNDQLINYIPPGRYIVYNSEVDFDSDKLENCDISEFIDAAVGIEKYLKSSYDQRLSPAVYMIPAEIEARDVAIGRFREQLRKCEWLNPKSQ